MITKDKFCEITKVLLDDTFDFLYSKKGQFLKISGAPPEYYRYLKLTPRRGIGKTYTGFNFMFNDEYYPTMMVFHNEQYKKDAMKHWEENNFLIAPNNTFFTAREILDFDFLPSLGGQTRQGKNSHYPSHFKLGIIDDKQALLNVYHPEKVKKIQDIMFACCEVVLEMG